MSKFLNQIQAACFFATRGIWVRRASFWPLWLALALAIIMLILMKASGHIMTDLGEANSLAGILGTSNMNSIYDCFLLAGMMVCLLQSQLLIMRALREERRHLAQMAVMGIHPALILFAKGLEYGLHALMSAVFGSIFGGIVVTVLLPAALQAIITPQTFLLTAIITLSCIPTSLIFVAGFLKKPRSQMNVII